MPEAKLAREAEIRYITVAMVTDFDCWHPEHEEVDVQMVVKTLIGNAEKAKNMVKLVIENVHMHPLNQSLLGVPVKHVQLFLDQKMF